jgi:hypothetical protein
MAFSTDDNQQLMIRALQSLMAVPGEGGQGWTAGNGVQYPPDPNTSNPMTGQPLNPLNGDLGLQQEVGSPNNPLEVRPDLAEMAQMSMPGAPETRPGLMSAITGQRGPNPNDREALALKAVTGVQPASVENLDTGNVSYTPNVLPGGSALKQSGGAKPQDTYSVPKNLNEVNAELIKNARSSAAAMGRQAEIEATVQTGVAEAAKNTRNELQNIAGEQQKFAEDMKNQLRSVASEAVDLAKQKIEPGRIFTDTGVFGSLVAFGSTFMSGYLGTKYGKPNEVANQISAIINRDIEAQMFDINNKGKNLDRKYNLLSSEIDLGKSDFEARTKTSITAHKLVADELVANGTAMGAKDKAIELGNALMTNALKEAGDNFKVSMQVAAQNYATKSHAEIAKLQNFTNIGVEVMKNSTDLLKLSMAGRAKGGGLAPDPVTGYTPKEMRQNSVTISGPDGKKLVVGVTARESGDTGAGKVQEKLTSYSDLIHSSEALIKRLQDKGMITGTTGWDFIDQAVMNSDDKVTMNLYNKLLDNVRSAANMGTLGTVGEQKLAVLKTGGAPSKTLFVLGASPIEALKSLRNTTIQEGNRFAIGNLDPELTFAATGNPPLPPFRDEAGILADIPGVTSGVQPRQSPAEQMIKMLQSSNPLLR